ncbi:hypothetical protein KQY30_23355 [Streptomyces sp. GMY02]|uniref:hypothetical protein n=1 Tax=Streptomyces sp. GMY02 TaxID=1333528 RepID=UPI001C2C9551|nr:hypothetical protein [Streptomyces sp. GMY02]QXE39361.1 hypothetical protein KQY30_23355 [Streptomyces sp. GMY02]
MSPRRILAIAVAAMALVLGQLAVGSASAAPAVEASKLQQKIDRYVDTHPGTEQISANKVRIPGGTLTVAVPGTTPRTAAAPSCSHGWLCIQDGLGDYYDYYDCGYYEFWGIGDGTFNNDQTSGTVARFYNSDGTQRWSNTAKDTGTASWSPVYYIRPC